MKLLFLDIDGVLNNYTTMESGGFNSRRLTDMLEWGCVEILNDICAKTEDPSVVLSSSWRLAFGAEDTLKALRKKGYTGPDFIGETPVAKHNSELFNNSSRSQDIAEFLLQNGRRLRQETKWDGSLVILDDCNIFGPLKPFHVQPSFTHGLTADLAVEAIHILHHGGSLNHDAF